MEQRLRILHLEDNNNDAELIRERLADEGIVCDIARVETREDFIAAIERGGIDIILADYKLPLFDGLSALAIKREKSPDIPFIFVSGVIGEDRAIESLTSGATDYVIKDRLSRLAPAMNRAMEEVKIKAEQTKAQEALKEREKFLGEILNSIQDGISILDKDLNIISVNPTMEKWYSHRSPLNGKKCYAAYHGRNEPCAICPSLQTLKSGKQANEIVSYEGPEGRKGWLDLFSFPLMDSRTGELTGVIEYVRDITARRQAEEEKQKLINQLQEALEKVKTLSGLLPICASCKKIRDDNGYWNYIEVYISEHSEAEFSHGLCPECEKKAYEELKKLRKNNS